MRRTVPSCHFFSLAITSVCVLATVVSLASASHQQGTKVLHRKRNVVLVITDDLDERLGSVERALNGTLKYFRKHGTIFDNAFVTTPVCCPSRSSMLSGMYAHNHGALTNNEECNGQFWKENIEAKTIGVRMQNAGYHTAYIGKYLNNLNPKVVPPGWNHWFVQHGNSKYYDFTVWRGSSGNASSGNVTGNVTYSGQTRATYFTNVVQKETMRLLEEIGRNASSQRKPLFAIVSLPAPHGRADAEPQYQRLFVNATAPRNPNFDYQSPDKHWIIRYRKPLAQSEMRVIDFMYRRRLQTLRSVDNLVSRLFRKLQSTRLLDSTYVFFTSDHGYHLGQFSQLKGKNQPYEEDIRVPMFAFGPDIPKGERVRKIVLNIDLAPTFVDIAKDLNRNRDMDGMSIMMLLKKLKKSRTRPDFPVNWRTSFLVEKFKGMQHLYETEDFFHGQWSRKVPVLRVIPPVVAASGPVQRPASQASRFQRFRDESGATVRLKTRYKLPQSRSNLTVTTNTTIVVRASMVVKLVRWMRHSSCKPIQVCTLQYLRAQYATRDRQRRQKRSILRNPGTASLFSAQEECDCLPPDLENACHSNGRTGWMCNLRPCPANGNKSQRELRRCGAVQSCKKAGLGCSVITPRHWRTGIQYTGPDICHCPNTRNSSYWCERRIDERHDYLYCKFVTGWEEYFDMRPVVDPWQLHNLRHNIARKPSLHKRLLARLSYMRTCQGKEQCFSNHPTLRMTSLERDWQPVDIINATPPPATLTNATEGTPTIPPRSTLDDR